MMKQKKIIALDMSSIGKGGGPYTFVNNILKSDLNTEYDFRIINYDVNKGRFISIKRILDLKKQLNDIKPDVVHFGGLQLSGFHIAIACKLAKIDKTLLTIHGSSSEAINFNFFQRVILYIIEFLTLCMVKKFHGVSEYSLKINVLKSFKKKSVGFIYNLPNSKLENHISYNRKKFGLTEDDIVVATVSRINKEKGLHILKNSILKCNNSNIKYLIIGDGDYLNEMKKDLNKEQLDSKVIFLGYRDDILNILPFCDIFVLPTLHETLSIALLEAALCGLPLIAPKVGGIPEIISNNGFLIKPNDSDEILKYVNILSSDELLRKEMGKNSTKIIQDKFNPIFIMKKMEKIYEEL